MSDLPPGSQVLHDAETVRHRVRELGRRLAEDAPAEVVMVVIEEGARRFATWLQQVLHQQGRDVAVVPIRVRRSQGRRLVEPRIASADLSTTRDAWTVVVDDIADEGRTLEAVLERVQGQGPRVLRTAVLVDKPAHRQCPIRLDYVGFPVPDVWMLGCGMDLDGAHREIDELIYLQPEPPQS